eukprot:CAMPEP_0177617314 /NCGR_PEP_ID=MMETSP0419_2-20121207/24788_1 /TAXON_ID=582737 /ORGANISM="Tetraselmis sp., Strain GSL018" /LENGTH=240 /DNA_ID=CAMNT_0019115761 /DNA_START=273 /DNA_END=992 /DNA_ORIENTATION=-
MDTFTLPSNSTSYYSTLPNVEEFRASNCLLSTIKEDVLESASLNALKWPMNAVPITVCTRKLKHLDSELSGVKAACNSLLTRMCCLIPPKQRLQEHLIFGDAQPAVVVNTSPLIVAAYAAPFDCITMLQFRQTSLFRELDLSVGTRLLTVNTYKRTNGSLDEDLEPGPEAEVDLTRRDVRGTFGGTSGHGNPLYETKDALELASNEGLRYSGVYPIIADFITEDSEALIAKKQLFQNCEW